MPRAEVPAQIILQLNHTIIPPAYCYALNFSMTPLKPNEPLSLLPFFPQSADRVTALYQVFCLCQWRCLLQDGQRPSGTAWLQQTDGKIGDNLGVMEMGRGKRAWTSSMWQPTCGSHDHHSQCCQQLPPSPAGSLYTFARNFAVAQPSPPNETISFCYIFAVVDPEEKLSPKNHTQTTFPTIMAPDQSAPSSCLSWGSINWPSQPKTRQLSNANIMKVQH